MADSGGFEPPTARFVAEYSIQLSYESVWRFLTRSPLAETKRPASLQVIPNMVHSGGFEPPTARFVAGYSIQLSYECTKRAHYKEQNLIIKHLSE